MSDEELQLRLAVAAAFYAEGRDVHDKNTICKTAEQLNAYHYGAVVGPRARLIRGALLESGVLNVSKAVTRLSTAPGGTRARIVFQPRVPVGERLRVVAVRLAKVAVIAFFAYAIYTAPPPKPNTGLEKVQVQEAVTRALNDVFSELGNYKSPMRASLKAAYGTVAERLGPDAAAKRAPAQPALSGAPERSLVAKDRLVTWARRALRVTFEHSCPPKDRDAAGTFWPATRRIQVCPDLKDDVTFFVTTHEVAHALQGVRGRLGRSKEVVEPEADVIAIVALRAAGFNEATKGHYYLEKPGQFLQSLLASRPAIEAMALTLAQVMRGEQVTR